MPPSVTRRSPHTAGAAHSAPRRPAASRAAPPSRVAQRCAHAVPSWPALGLSFAVRRRVDSRCAPDSATHGGDSAVAGAATASQPTGAAEAASGSGSGSAPASSPAAAPPDSVPEVDLPVGARNHGQRPVAEVEPWATVAAAPVAPAASDFWAETPTAVEGGPVDSSPAAAPVEECETSAWPVDEPVVPPHSIPPLADLMDEDDDVGPHVVFPDSAYWESAVDEVLSPTEAAAAEAERLRKLQARQAAAAGVLGAAAEIGSGAAAAASGGGSTGNRPQGSAGALVLRSQNTSSGAGSGGGAAAARDAAIRKLLPLALLGAMFVAGAAAGMLLAAREVVVAPPPSVLRLPGWLARSVAGADSKLLTAGAAALATVVTTPALFQAALCGTLVMFTRQGLEPTLKWMYDLWQLADPTKRKPWERSIWSWALLDVYRPAEAALVVTAAVHLLDWALLPPRTTAAVHATIAKVGSAAVSLAVVTASTRVLRAWSTRFFAELLFQAEMSGRPGAISRVEGTARLAGIVTTAVAALLGAQALGFDLGSLLAVGGISGLAIGLAGREILGNVFAGLMLYATSPFAPGEHVKFVAGSQRDLIDGNIVDVGLFRTTIRSFERELFTVPNSLFSTTVVLNVSRKGREWRVEELVLVRHGPPEAVQKAIKDLRSVIKADERVIKALHRRVFLNRLTPDGFELIVSFYIEAVNRDQYLAVREDMYLTMLQIFARYGIQLATPVRAIRVENTRTSALPPRAE